jgi:hypothetical protein
MKKILQALTDDPENFLFVVCLLIMVFGAGAVIVILS